MAITNFDQYIGAVKQHIQISKSGAVTTTAGNWATTIAAAGFPSAGASPANTTTGVVPTDATTGFPAIQAFNGSNIGYLSRVEASSPVNQALALFDVIFWAGPTTIPTSGTTTVTLGTQPSFTGRLPFRSDGSTPAYEEVEMWVWLSTAGSNHAHTFQMSYKDQDDNTAESSATVSTQNVAVNRVLRVPWNAGDYGARLMNGYLVNGATSSTGAVTAMFLRRLWTGRVEANTHKVFGPDLTGMPRVFDTSAIMLMCLPESTSTSTPNVLIEIAEG
jgi:hypothetical protein